MIALTIHEPYVWCFTDAGKRIENRTWSPGRALARGDFVALHVGKTYDLDAAIELGFMLAEEGLIVPGEDNLVMSAVGAVARFHGVTSGNPGGDQARWRSDAEYAWIFDEVWKLPTRVPCRGRQKLWTLPDDVQAEVDHQWGKCEGPC